MAPENIKRELATPYPVSHKEINSFRDNGFIKLKSVLSQSLMEYMNKTITAEVKRLNTQHLPLDQRDTYGKAFLQIMNIWTQSEPVKEIVFSTRFAKLASDLLEVSGVRLYHDQALYKEAGGGITPWHADQYYWPLSSEKTVTLWAPMQETPNELGPLEFSAKSNHLTKGRDLKIGDESQQMLEETLAKEGYKTVAGPFEMGEVSFHTGWLYHRAGANKSNHMRAVMTIIYMDKDMKLKEPTNENQVEDLNAWLPGAVVGEIVDTKLNPILYEG